MTEYGFQARFSKPVIEISVIVVQAIETESRVLENMSHDGHSSRRKTPGFWTRSVVESLEEPLALTQWTGRSCLEE